MAIPCVVLNYKGASDTIQCLRSLREATKLSLEVIVVDNGSGPVELRTLSSLPYSFRLISLPSNCGFSAGMNTGIRSAISAGPRFVLLMNNDVEVYKGSIEKMLEAAREIRNAGIVVPNQRFHRSKMRRQLDLESFLRASEPRDLKHAAGFCWLVRADVFSNVGFFDEDFLFGREDDDFCRRAINRGYRVVEVPQALVYHKLEGSDKSGNQKGMSRFRSYHLSRGRGLYLRKHYRGTSLAALAALSLPYLLRDIAAATIDKGIDFRRAYLAFQGYADGLAEKPKQARRFQVE